MRRGFTLIELIVVIAIIAVLAAVVAPNAFRAIERSRISATVADLNGIKTAVYAYFGDTSAWPISGAAGLSTGLIANNGGAGGAAVATWDGPYIGSWPATNKWGGTYTYLNDAAFDWNGAAPGDQARYVTLSAITLAAATRIDAAIDGAFNAATGSCRYTAATSILTFLISADAGVI